MCIRVPVIIESSYFTSWKRMNFNHGCVVECEIEISFVLLRTYYS